MIRDEISGKNPPARLIFHDRLVASLEARVGGAARTGTEKAAVLQVRRHPRAAAPAGNHSAAQVLVDQKVLLLEGTEVETQVEALAGALVSWLQGWQCFPTVPAIRIL